MKTIDLRALKLGRGCKPEEKTQRLRNEGYPNHYFSANKFVSGVGIVSDGKPCDYEIIYPTDVSVTHCPKCLEEFVSSNDLSNYAVDCCGAIITLEDSKSSRFFCEAQVETLHWGRSGHLGICHKCNGTTTPNY